MNDIINRFDQISSYANSFNAAPIGEVAVALVKESSLTYPKAFTKIESALSSGTAAITAPLHSIKDLILAGIAAPFIGSSPSAKSFAAHRAISAGVDFAGLFVGIVGMVYPFTPLPSMIKKQFPQLPNDIPAYLANMVKDGIDNLAEKVKGTDNILKIGELIEENCEFATEVLEEIPELKFIAPLLPHTKQILEEVLELRQKKKVHEILTTLEKMNNSSYVGLILATVKNHSSQHGKRFTKIDSATSFGMVGLTSIVHIITHLFMTIISAPFALYSESSKAFFLTQLSKMKLSLACLVIGFLGLFSPDKAEAQFKKLTINHLPTKWQAPIGKLWHSLSQISMEELKNTIQSFSMEKMKAKVAGLLPKLVQISQRYPEGIENLAKLADLLGMKLPDNLIKAAAPLIKEIAQLEDKHPGVIQDVTTMVMDKNWKELPQILGKYPELSKNIANAIGNNAELVNSLAEIPAIKEAMPEGLAQTAVPLIKEVAKLEEKHSGIIQDMAEIVIDKNWQGLPELFEKRRDLPQDLVSAIADKEELVNAIAQLPAIKDAVPPEVAKDIPNIVKEGVAIAKEYPQIITELSQIPNNGNSTVMENLESFAGKYPGLEDKVKEFMQTYPEFETWLHSPVATML